MKDIQILLVDDEERFVQNLAKLLKAREYDVFSASDGARAIERLKEEKKIDIVVLDVCMPGIDGLETLRRIKEHHAAIKVLMLTGRATMEDGVQALRLGAFDYLQKPFDIEELTTKIETACRVERIRRRPVMWPRRKAGDILLTGLYQLLPEDTMSRAMMIFRRYSAGEGVRILFVVDDHYYMQGILSRDDLLSELRRRYPEEAVTWRWVMCHPEHLLDIAVDEFMQRETSAVSLYTPLSEAAQLMLSHGWDSIPVVFEDRVLGIVRLRDTLRHLQGNDEIIAKSS